MYPYKVSYSEIDESYYFVTGNNVLFKIALIPFNMFFPASIKSKIDCIVLVNTDDDNQNVILFDSRIADTILHFLHNHYFNDPLVTGIYLCDSYIKDYRPGSSKIPIEVQRDWQLEKIYKQAENIMPVEKHSFQNKSGDHYFNGTLLVQKHNPEKEKLISCFRVLNSLFLSFNSMDNKRTINYIQEKMSQEIQQNNIGGAGNRKEFLTG